MLLVALVLPGCATASTAPLPRGWSWYHNSQFAFQVPVPPAWQAHAYWAGEGCAYEIDLVPPVSAMSYASNPSGEQSPELMRVVVVVNCPDWTPSDNPHLTPQTQPILIGGTQATLYRDATLTSGIVQMALARFGGHQYEFAFEYDDTATTPDMQAQANLALYQQVLRGFTYTGK